MQNPLDIQAAIDLLRRGKNVIIPTETVYGLAGRFDDPEAVLGIFSAKARPQFNPLIVHVPTPEAISGLVTHVTDTQKLLMEHFWPGPLTILFQKTSKISDLITAGLPTAAIRCPAHPIAQQILSGIGVPLVAPSANLFGTLSATRFEDLDPILLSKVAGAVDGGQAVMGIESTVVFPLDDRIEILRHGAISLEEIASATGLPLVESRLSPSHAPGRLKAHYAPKTPLVLFENKLPEVLKSGSVILAFSNNSMLPQGIPSEVLSPSGDLREAARNLFPILHDLDRRQASCIYAQKAPGTGLGLAINDRLERAAFTTESNQN